RRRSYPGLALSHAAGQSAVQHLHHPLVAEDTAGLPDHRSLCGADLPAPRSAYRCERLALAERQPAGPRGAAGGLCQEHVCALTSAVEQYLVLQLDVLVQFLTENLQFAVQGSPGAARILRWLVVVGQPPQPGQALIV